MKTQQKLRTITDVEYELSIITSCQKRSKMDLSIFQIFDFIGSFIESSIQSAGLKSSVGIWNRFIGKYKFAKLMSIGVYTKATQINGFPNKSESGDEKYAENRLKTALTAFKLHSGPFGEHPVYGELDKKQWERVISILSGFLFSYIELEGDEKLRFYKEKESQREKHEQKKQDKRESTYLKEKGPRDGNQPNRNQNRNWKNKKKNHYKGNKNQGGGPK
ncbi:MAG: DUF1569 domain-containing protein [Leptospira sp.]|nr:DUF1569 domain-containing protein [Leptospira sp.]